MSRALKCGTAILILMIVFGAGFFSGVTSHLADSVVHLELKNETGKVITSVRVVHERGTATATTVAPGATASIDFCAHGETSFLTTVEFADGSLFEGSEQYAEPGYRFATMVTDDGLEERVALY